MVVPRMLAIWMGLVIAMSGQDSTGQQKDQPARSPDQSQDDQNPDSGKPDSHDKETEERIQQKIRELGAAKFLVRQAASAELWKIGRPAEPALRAALSSTNAEIVARAEAILSDFDYGIYPDTDPETKKIIVGFRDGDFQSKKEAGESLLQVGEIETLIKLILKEQDRATLKSLMPVFFGHSRFVLKLIEEGRTAQALSSLRLIIKHSTGFGLTQQRVEELRSEYLWLATVTDTLASQLPSLRADAGPDPKFQERFFLIRCLRALRQYERCAAETEKLQQKELKKLIHDNLLVEQRKWSELSDRHWIENRKPIGDLDLNELLNAITYHRIAGRTGRFEADLKVLYEFSDPLVEDLALDRDTPIFQRVNNTTIFTIVEFLFTNRQIEKAIEYLAKTDKLQAFNACVSIDDYQRAFDVLGFDNVDSDTAKSIEKQIRAFRPTRWTESIREVEGFRDIIHAFYQLGFYDEAKSMYRALYSMALRYESKQSSALATVCNSLLSNEQKELFFDLIRPQMRAKPYDFAIESLFEDLDYAVRDHSLASFWWAELEGRLPKLKPIERLKLLDRYLHPLLPGQQPDPEFLKLLQEVETEILSSDESWGQEAYIGYTYLLLNQSENAIKWFEKYQKSDSFFDSSVAIEIGDLYRKANKLPLAVDAYLAAWDSPLDKSPLGLYLAGLTEKQQGNLPTAERYIQMAKAYVVQSKHHRELPSDLMDRKFDDAARQTLEVSIKISDFQSWELGTARWYLLGLLKDEEGFEAANHVENLLLDVAATTRYYPSVASYTYYPFQAHVRNFDQWTVEGQPEKAFAAAQAALKIRPCSASIAEDCLPKLRKLDGGDALADQLFDRIFNEYKEKLKVFPNSGLFNNNLAWICTTNKKHLQVALVHAEKVVKNEPENSTYIDTLADVCFNLGQIDRAIQLMEKCLSIDPKSEHYNQQIKRFRAARNSQESN